LADDRAVAACPDCKQVCMPQIARWAARPRFIQTSLQHKAPLSSQTLVAGVSLKSGFSIDRRRGVCHGHATNSSALDLDGPDWSASALELVSRAPEQLRSPPPPGVGSSSERALGRKTQRAGRFVLCVTGSLCGTRCPPDFDRPGPTPRPSLMPTGVSANRRA